MGADQVTAPDVRWLCGHPHRSLNFTCGREVGHAGIHLYPEALAQDGLTDDERALLLCRDVPTQCGVDRLLAARQRPTRQADTDRAVVEAVVHADHPYTDPGDGRQECQTCGKWVWLVIHSCKGVPVTPAAVARAAAASEPT